MNNHFSYLVLHRDSGYPGEVGGGDWSTAVNMATWLKFLLNRGVHDGQRVVADDVFYNIYWPENAQSPGGYRKPQYPFSKESPVYGLGFALGHYRGIHKLILDTTASCPCVSVCVAVCLSLLT